MSQPARLTSDPLYTCARASVYYWKKLGRTDPTAVAKLAYWQGLLDDIRAKHRSQLPKPKAKRPERPEISKMGPPPPLCWD